ncbi:MAG: histidinol-phosphatase [Planctomycetota bacterium]|nr:MAG: histidinol-phosphatase [Planctomycetota bacterium]
MKACFMSKRSAEVVFACAVFSLVFAGQGVCKPRVRDEVKIPDVGGYLTLACDFHMHTIFSDGRVWPEIRAEEAWREGLDAFAITEHIEYQRHEKDVRTNHNRSYEIAKGSAESLRLVIIKGAEITREMPPGHFNAIFLKDANALDVEEWRDAIKEAVEQKAFVWWNHPGWRGQQPDGKSIWYEEHTELYKKGWMDGIEIVNDDEYYPLAHKWALEKKLTMIGGSDVHTPTGLNYDFHTGEHRSMTLVLSKEKSEGAIKDALLNRRTVVYWRKNLIGEEKYLRPIFDGSIEILNPEVTIKGKGSAYVQILNKSEVDFELESAGEVEEISAPGSVTLYGEKVNLLRIRGKKEDVSGEKEMRLAYKVKNLWVGPEEGLRAELVIKVNLVPAKKK